MPWNTLLTQASRDVIGARGVKADLPVSLAPWKVVSVAVGFPALPSLPESSEKPSLQLTRLWVVIKTT